jgi:hypothetical protein
LTPHRPAKRKRTGEITVGTIGRLIFALLNCSSIEETKRGKKELVAKREMERCRRAVISQGQMLV